MTTIALAIPHTPWIPERVASMARLENALGTMMVPGFSPEPSSKPWGGIGRVFTDRAPNKVWSEQLWLWGLETGADYLCQLQDDVLVSPHFWPELHAMIAAVPDQVIGLEAAHPRGRQLARAGIRWYTTADFLVGVAYVLPRAFLDAFLDWRAHELRDGWVIDEDMLIGLFCLVTGRMIYHPIPTVVDHDVSLASNYGHENHSHRRPSVTWENFEPAGPVASWEAPDFWRPRAVPHLGRFYSHTPNLARRWVKGFGEREWRRAQEDVWRGLVVAP
jgi:hypothetical protein